MTSDAIVANAPNKISGHVRHTSHFTIYGHRIHFVIVYIIGCARMAITKKESMKDVITHVVFQDVATVDNDDVDKIEDVDIVVQYY